MTEARREHLFTLAWWGKRPVSFVLPGFLIISLFAHILAFLLFQISYPEKVAFLPTAPKVSLLMPSSSESISMLHWIESEDPALVAASARAEPKGLAKLEYHPFFSAVHTPARILEPAPDRAAFPAGRDPLEIINSVAPPPVAARPTPAPARTQASISGELAGRNITRPPEFTPCSSRELAAAQFLIGVTDRGEVRYTFLQRSSGDPAADNSAAASLSKASFEPTANPITWGFATISWGDDIYLRPPATGSTQPAKTGSK